MTQGDRIDNPGAEKRLHVLLVGHRVHPVTVRPGEAVGEVMVLARVGYANGDVAWRMFDSATAGTPSPDMLRAMDECEEDLLDELVSEWVDE